MVPLLFLLLVGAAAAPSTESLYRQAQAAFDRGDNATAGRIAADTLARAGAADDVWTWRLRLVHGNVLINKGEFPAARKLLGRVLPKALADSEIAVLRLQGLALAAKRQKDAATAESLIAQAYDLAKKKQQRTLPMLLVVRATIDTPNAIKWAREAVKYAQQFGDVGVELRARGTIGNALARTERFDEAIAVWEEDIPKARKAGNESLVQKLEGNLGWAYMELGDYETAGELFSRAHATATRLGVEVDVVPWTYQLGNVRLEQRDFAAAEKLYLAAYELAKRTNHWQKPIVLAYLANFELLRGHVAEAQKYADESLRERKTANDPEGELRSLLIVGRIAAAGGNLGEAKRVLHEVLSRSDSVTTKWEAHGRLAQLHVTEGKTAEAEEQFGLSVATAREAREKIASEHLRFSFFTAVDDIFSSYIDFLIAQKRHADALRVTETIRAQTLEEGLNDTVDRRDPRTIARDTNATILCYWLGSTHSYLWIVTPKTVQAIPLPPKRKIEAMIERYQLNLMSGAGGSLTQSGARGAELWKMLVAPAARVIAPRSRVIIVPDGRLHAFNMETLVVPTSKRYWIEDVVLSTSGSLGLLVRKEPASKAQWRLLLVGDPPQPADFAALPYARDEITRVSKHFGGRATVLSGAKATPSAYRNAPLQTFTHVHFVAHAVAARLKPLDSAIVLAREGNDSFKLYARDIAKQPLNARLVTISSCHGAGTRAYAGEGLVGLGWAFQRVGADNVIAALWEVNDRATPDLMDAFYGSLAKGTPPANALRDAKLWMINKGGSSARPYYWAPFTLYGSG